MVREVRKMVTSGFDGSYWPEGGNEAMFWDDGKFYDPGWWPHGVYISEKSSSSI